MGKYDYNGDMTIRGMKGIAQDNCVLYCFPLFFSLDSLCKACFACSALNQVMASCSSVALCASSLLLAFVLLAITPTSSALAEQQVLDFTLPSFPHEALSSFSANHPLIDAWLNPERHFIQFLKRHAKNYTGVAFRHRLEVFKRNILLAAENQLNDLDAEHGITQFSDLTPDEFAATRMGLLPGAEKKSMKEFLKLRGSDAGESRLPTENLPEAFDWREKGAVSDVKNQVDTSSGRFYPEFGSRVHLGQRSLADAALSCSI